MQRIFEARAVRHEYNGITALNLPEFFMDKGECVALTGRNGSGKSTLLRLLAFIEKPFSGEVRYFGGNPHREISLLLQEPYLMRGSVFWNVTLGLRLRGLAEGMNRAYEEAMQAVGFPDPMLLAGRGPRALSGGERQRVAMAARLALSPSVLLLDEPTSNVDTRSSQVIVTAVRRCVDQGTSVICATHDPELIAALGAREVRIGNDFSG